MASAANHEAYGNPSWGNAPPGGAQPWGNPQGNPNGNPGWNGPGWNPPGWGGPPFWHPAGISRPVAIALTILGFILWWPVGLALLIAMIWSGRMGCWGRRRMAGDQSGGWQGPSAPWNAWKSWCNTAPAAPSSSGNRAFDEYRAETLRRLEEEQKEFGSFLDRLRFAKDKAEFDQFMAERRQRPPQPPAQPEEPART
jgi:hypothetical protein